MSVCKCWVYLLSAIFLVSCNGPKSAQSAFDNYVYRLTNVLDAGHIKLKEISALAPLKRYPMRRELTQSILPAKINLLDFLRLSSCDLQRHVGERNSSLGRVLQSSQRMFYEYKFIHLGEECLQQLAPSSELFRLLDASIESKREQLPIIRWNATFASKEFSTLFSLSASPLDIENVATIPTQLYGALDTINQYTQTDLLLESDEKQLEQAFSVITSSKRMGEIRHSMRLVRHFLAHADTILESRLSSRPLCLKQKPNKEFEVLQVVFTKFYIGEIQPYISKLHQQSEALFTRIQELSDGYADSSIPFTEFWWAVFLSNDSEWQLFDRSIKQHTSNWQQLLAQCGRLPS